MNMINHRRTSRPEAGAHRGPYILAAWLCIATLGAGSHALAAAPDLFVQEIIGGLMTKAGTMDASAEGSAVKARDLLRGQLGPHIDFQALARWILREHWTDANDAEKRAFLRIFENHLINTYALALVRGLDTRVVVAGTPQIREKTATVAAELLLPNGVRQPVEFRLIRAGDTWRLFDFTTDGVSFARILRAEFSGAIRRGGIVALTEQLASSEQ